MTTKTKKETPCYFVLSVGQIKKALAEAQRQLEENGGRDQFDLNCLVFEGDILCKRSLSVGGSKQVSVRTVRTPYTPPGQASRI